MKLSQLKDHLQSIDAVRFIQPNGAPVPAHFHITEVGLTTKSFIDCGGAVHEEKRVNLQIWVADDLDHRLDGTSLLGIIQLSEKVLQGADYEVDVEYQTDTIGKYTLDFENDHFLLIPTHTDCLAPTKCNLVQPKKKVQLSALTSDNSCAPGSGCC